MSRGPHQKDARLFGPEALPLLRTAAEEVVWLLGRGYPVGTVVDFVGSRHQLRTRQRVALTRTLCSEVVRQRREAQERPAEAMAGETLHIDGFNLVITLEVALSGGVLLVGHDGAIRDLAGLRGTYRLIDVTDEALALIGRALAALRPASVIWYLDRPVSNSGRLRERIISTAADWPVETEVRVVPNPDRVLVGKELVVSADAVVIDTSANWVNLLAWIVARYIPTVWRVSLAGPGYR